MFDEIGVVSAFLLAAFLLLSAFFSGSEAALLSVQRVRLAHLINLKIPGATRVARLIEHPEKLLPPILLGNNLVNTGAAAIATSIAITLIEDESMAVLIATASVTIALLIFGETVPKTIATKHPERFSIIVAAPVQALAYVLRPISYLLQLISTATASIFGSNSSVGEITEEEIKAIVQVGSDRGAVEQGEADIIRRVLEFGDRKVNELMTPRPEIITVLEGTTVTDFFKIYNDNYHTRFPVIRDNLDDVIGFIAVKDVMRQLSKGTSYDSSTTSSVRSVRFVPETKRVQELFDEMRASGDQMVMVVDEFGGIAGLVTLKRLVEGMVGRVGDKEENQADTAINPLDENTVELDAGLSISEANERLGLGLPAGEYETVAGFLLEQLGRIPTLDVVVVHKNFRCAIVEMKGARISRVRLTRVVSENG
ncbi:MAG: hemolysin [Dehalococcoidia bacterium]|jgi:putative hemolysin|nr:hemolysin [Dehalococcoidia bacterium]MCH2531475.1 hemolysin family protein [Dehalococcoidia bacterium]HCH35512.1 HlyC/CorC family transporter [Dehalococcoidia bacterium]|tara:strand:- start:4374 stop:5648 length:1275 start_codon:yes stop_codon:yes gene_type:complete